MSRKSPYRRQPCGGRDKTLHIGGCKNHWKNSDSGISKKFNTTKQKNYANPAVPAYIEPYEMPDQITDPSCSPYDKDIYECGDYINGNVPCGPAETGSFFYFSGSTFNVGSKYKNSYTVSDTEKVSHAACELIGHKSIYAKVNWVGRYSYSSRFPHMQNDYMDWCGACAYHNFDSSPPSVKYLSMNASSTIDIHKKIYGVESVTESGEVCCPKEGGGEECSENWCVSYELEREHDFSAHANNSVSIDKFGNLYVGSASSGSSGFSDTDPEVARTTAEGWAQQAWELLSKANGNINDAVAAFLGEQTNLPVPDVIQGDGVSWHLEWHDTLECYDYCGNLTKSQTYAVRVLDVNISAGTFEKKYFGEKDMSEVKRGYCTSDGSCKVIVNTSHETMRYSGTSMLWTHIATGIGSISLDEHATYKVIGNLAAPYSKEEVQQTMRSLLGEYPLDDDALLPWTTALDLVGPLISYDAGGGAPSIGHTQGSQPYSGRIMGRPAPKGISPGVWNPEHKNYEHCVSLGGFGEECHTRYIETWGAWSPYPCMTQWLNKWEAIQMPWGLGAWVGWNFFETTPTTCNSTGPTPIYDDAVWGCKYAEIIIPSRKSYNAALPCGKYRFQVSENSPRCVVSSSANALALEQSQPDTDINTGDYVWVCGVGDLDGAWKASKIDAHTIALTECFATGSLLPTGLIEDCGTGMVAKLRWQLIPPAICGRVDITDASTTTPITISFAEPQFLGDKDKIIITGAEGANINGLWNIKVIDPSTVSFLGSVGTTATTYKKNSAQAYSPGAPDWRYNTDEPMQDFLINEWYMTYRDVGEHDRIVTANETQVLNTHCDYNSNCSAQSVPPNPRTNQSPLPQSVYSMRSFTDCMPKSPCKPSIVFWSPNETDTFSKTEGIQGAKNYGFPSVQLDPQYGGLAWFARVKQTQDHLLWQAPPCPCSYESGEEGEEGTYGCHRDPLVEVPWREDDGSCNYGAYPHAPQIEARQEQYPGSPALPTGARKYGCLTPSEIAAGRSGNYCFPPSMHNANLFSTDEDRSLTVIVADPPYSALYLAEKQCVCANGNFAANYMADDGVACGDIVPPPF